MLATDRAAANERAAALAAEQQSFEKTRVRQQAEDEQVIICGL